MGFTARASLIFHVVAITINFLLVAFRGYATLARRQYGHRSPAALASDALILFSFLFLVLMASWPLYRVILQVNNQANPPVTDYFPPIALTKAQIPIGLKSIIAEMMAYVVTTWMSRAAILAMLWEVKGHLSKLARHTLYFTTFYTTATFTAVILFGFFKCVPFSRNWSTTSTFCTPVDTVTIWTVLALTMIMDILIFGIPMLLVGSLKLPTSRLLALALTITLFVIGSVVSIVRSVITSHFAGIEHHHVVDSFSIEEMAKTEVTSMIQCTVALATACLPQMRVFFQGSDRPKEEILGLLPSTVGSLVITKTVEVKVSLNDMDQDSMRRLKGRDGNSSRAADWTHGWNNI